MWRIRLAAIAAVLLIVPGAAQRQPEITVNAGDFDREYAIVSFPLPRGISGECLTLASGKQTVPAQLGANREATFIVTGLGRSETRRYSIVTTDCNPSRIKPVVEAQPTRVSMERRDGPARVTQMIRVFAAGKPVLAYQTEPGDPPRADIKPIFKRGGYIHPVHTPEGRAITDDYPVDHPHHHGIWWAWTKTEYDGRAPDFWNMGDGTGRVDFDSLDAAWSGLVHGGLRATTRFTDVTGGRSEVVLKDQWDVRVYAPSATANVLVFDVLSTQTLTGNKPLVLPEYRYGGLGVRGHIQWNGKGDKTIFLTSEGKTRADGNGTTARWTHMGGLVDGRPAGIAILDHPSNFRAPQPTRLNPDNPFFNYSPSVAGDWKIEPGKPYVSRYRFVTYEGQPDRALLERLWNDYAHPPTITVSSR